MLHTCFIDVITVCAKVLYRDGGGGKSLIKKTTWLLGVWHPIKQCAILLFKVFGPTFLAPAFHHENPANCYPQKKARLSMALSTMVKMFVAYHKGGLRQAMLAFMEKKEKLKFEFRAHAQNLFDMFEYFIPTVT